MSKQTNDDTELTEIITHLDAILGIEARKPGAAASLPAVIRIHELLEPAGGKQFPVFPPSYAGEGQNAPPVYDLNGIEYGEVLEENEKSGRKRVARAIKRARQCTFDSPQSHANRTEIAFIEDETSSQAGKPSANEKGSDSKELSDLVPQGTAKIPREADLESRASENLLRLPHRVADFRVRLSDRKEHVASAIKAFSSGDALPLLHLMPTSIIFGFWDSRAKGYQHKHARILLSRIDAFDVIPCERHAVYSGPYSKDEFANEILGDAKLSNLLAAQEEEGEQVEGGKEAKKKAVEQGKKMAKRGFTAALAPRGLGGVIVDGTIERLSLVSLTDIARIFCRQPVESQEGTAGKPAKQKGKDKESNGSAVPSTPVQPIDKKLTNAARRYILALALLAEGYPRSTGSYRLRSGCELIALQKTLTIELRGNGADSDSAKALKALCTDRELLIKIAENAKAILRIPGTLANFSVSKDDLKKDLMEK